MQEVYNNDIEARLKRWFETPEYQDKWVVYNGSDVSVLDNLSSTRHRSICLVKELGCVIGEDAPMNIQEFLAQGSHVSPSEQGWFIT